MLEWLTCVKKPQVMVSDMSIHANMQTLFDDLLEGVTVNKEHVNLVRRQYDQLIISNTSNRYSSDVKRTINELELNSSDDANIKKLLHLQFCERSPTFHKSKTIKRLSIRSELDILGVLKLIACKKSNIDCIMEMLHSVDTSWELDMFELDRETHGNALVVLAYYGRKELSFFSC